MHCAMDKDEICHDPSYKIPGGDLPPLPIAIIAGRSARSRSAVTERRREDERDINRQQSYFPRRFCK
jgi:hypothetical protein